MAQALAMFWQDAHVQLPGFPRLDADLPAEPCEGDHVGPLELHGPVGSGMFGMVVAAMNHETEEGEAVKIVEKATVTDEDEVRNLWKEIRVLQMLKHDHIVACCGALHGPDHIYIRMELVAGGNLFQNLKRAGGRLIAEDAQTCQAQLSSAVAYCHGMCVAHCDLKPESVGLLPGRPLTLKILDMGSARRMDGDCFHPFGTVPFMPPEVLEADAAAPCRPTGSDIFASGVVLLEMLCGIGKLNLALGWGMRVRPTRARAEELRDLLQDSARLQQAFEEDAGEAPPELLRLLLGLLRADWRRRWTAARALRSSWLRPGLEGDEEEEEEEEKEEESGRSSDDPAAT